MNNVKSLVEYGYCAKRIAQKLNLKHKDVQDYIKSNSLILKHEPFSDDKINLICDLYKDGISAKQLGKKFNIDKRRVQKWVNKLGILRSKNDAGRFTEFNQHIFDEIDTPEKAYWLGFLYADGYNDDTTNTVNLCLKSNDRDHLVKYAKFLGLPKEKISFNTSSLGYSNCGLKAYSKHLCEQLTKLGCMRAKSFKITYPKWLDNSLHNHFIRGMFDGDGCLTFKKQQKEWRWDLVSTQNCCESIKQIFLQYSGVYVNYSCISQTNNDTYCLSTSGNEKIKKIMDWLYSGDSTSDIWLDRKYEKYLNLTTQQDNRKSKSEHKRISFLEKNEIFNEIRLGKNNEEISNKCMIHPQTVNTFREKVDSYHFLSQAEIEYLQGVVYNFNSNSKGKAGAFVISKNSKTKEIKDRLNFTNSIFSELLFVNSPNFIRACLDMCGSIHLNEKPYRSKIQFHCNNNVKIEEYIFSTLNIHGLLYDDRLVYTSKNMKNVISLIYSFGDFCLLSNESKYKTIVE